jgi:hypothetical protein
MHAVAAHCAVHSMCNRHFGTYHIMRSVSPWSCITSRHSTSVCPASLRDHTSVITFSICRTCTLAQTEPTCRRRLCIMSRAVGASTMNPANARGSTSPRSSLPGGMCLSRFKMLFSDFCVSGTPTWAPIKIIADRCGRALELTWTVPAEDRAEV